MFLHRIIQVQSDWTEKHLWTSNFKSGNRWAIHFIFYFNSVINTNSQYNRWKKSWMKERSIILLPLCFMVENVFRGMWSANFSPNITFCMYVKKKKFNLSPTQVAICSVITYPHWPGLRNVQLISQIRWASLRLRVTKGPLVLLRWLSLNSVLVVYWCIGICEITKVWDFVLQPTSLSNLLMTLSLACLLCFSRCCLFSIIFLAGNYCKCRL